MRSFQFPLLSLTADRLTSMHPGRL